MKTHTLITTFIMFFMFSAISAASPLDHVGEKISDVTLLDLDGKPVQLMDYHTGKVLVIAYTGLGCPISGRYAPRLESIWKKHGSKGVSFVAINANPQDQLDNIKKEMQELGVTFPVLQDHKQLLTKQLDAKTSTVCFVIDKDGVLRYRGMIDDQYAIGAQREKPRKRYLERAIRDVRAGRKLDISRTVAPGCLITRIKNVQPKQNVTYSSHIAKIIQDNCQSCHRPQQIAPFRLTSYKAVRGWSAMIYSVLEENRMPPWNAHPSYDSVFVNERRIPSKDKELLMAWIQNGVPEGNKEDLPPKKSWPAQWTIGRPDKVFSMQEMYKVPAEGVVEYQYFSVPTKFRKDMWIKAIEAKAGAADVVHHIIAFAVDRNKKNNSGGNLLNDGFLCATVPGDTPSFYADGMAKKLPVGHDLVLQVHYTTNGKKRKDRSKVAMIFTHDPVEYEVFTRGISNFSFQIPPGASNHEVRGSITLEQDIQILSFYPHMHFRGKDWKYIAHYPDGTSKELLHVPTYDYNWQESYALKDPISLPKGTELECIAHYDNSADNFMNPDPNITVRYGDQSWEEMFFGFIDYIVPVNQ